jgi:hypothetical protein
MQSVARLRRDYVRDYLRCLDFISVDRRAALAPNFAALLGGATGG